MSDSDNFDLALSVYDPEDNLHFYGSPVHGERSSPVHGEGSSSAGATAATTSCEYLAQTPQRTQVRVKQ